MSEQLDPLPDDVLARLNALQPPPAPPELPGLLLPAIHAAAGRTPPWWQLPVPRWVPAATLLAGTVIGVVTGQLVRPEPPPPPAPVSVAPAPAPLPTEPQREQVPAAPQRPAPARPPARPSTPSTPPSPDTLRQERILIDTARAALRLQAEPAEGLSAIAEHEQSFPRGQLREEREALAVQLLLRLGRTKDARSRLEAFRRDFPDSPLIQPLEESFP